MTKKTETEYAGTTPTVNGVQASGPNGRKLSSSEKVGLIYRTGQSEDPSAKIKPEFFYGNDRDYPEYDGDLTWPD